MIRVDLDKDPIHGWCTWFWEGLPAFEHLYAPVCKVHDILCALHELGINGQVVVHGQVYTWQKMGFDQVKTLLWIDRWMRDALLEIADHYPALSASDRRRVRRDAWTAYYGLRSLGLAYRALT
jgi:hypothetical protein